MNANLVQYVSFDGSIGLELQPADQMGNPFKGVWTLDASRPAVWHSDNPSATMAFPWGPIQAQVVLPPGQRATITVTAWVKLGEPLPEKPEDYQQLTATTVLDSQAPSMTGLCAVPSGGSNWTLSKITLPLLAMLAALACMMICGCQSATATKVSKDGTQDSIKVLSFLGRINQGGYSNGTGMTLTVTDASPDQQSIAILAGAVADVAKTAMLLGRTNVPATTNAP